MTTPSRPATGAPRLLRETRRERERHPNPRPHDAPPRVIEAAEMPDGRVAQTVHVGPEPGGEEYQRIVHFDEAYPDDEAGD
jgi:hypothetical protein